MPQSTAQGSSLDVLIIAGNARSLIANRGGLIRDMRRRIGASRGGADF